MGNGRGRMVEAKIGIIVAGDMPERWLGALEAREVDPIAILFRFKDGTHPPFECPCRPPNALETILLVNRALQEGRIEFGFRETRPNPLVLPGDHH